LWDLPAARCRFGKFLRVAVGRQPPDLRRLLEQFPPRVESTEYGDLARGLPIRLALERRAAHPGTAGGDNAIAGAAAQFDLGEGAKFFPSDAALAGWVAQADQGRAMVVYE
jgi:DNA polymerase-3 subunit alpha